jgi:hypothetical protein
MCETIELVGNYVNKSGRAFVISKMSICNYPKKAINVVTGHCDEHTMDR